MLHRGLTTREVQAIIVLVLSSGLFIQRQHALTDQAGRSSAGPRTALAAAPPRVVVAAELPVTRNVEESLEGFAARDPIGFFERALDRYERSVRDYTCTFTKQELLGGRMSSVQVVKAMFREKPFSVRLKVIKNPDRVLQVLYVADRWVKNGQQLAVVEPAGAIARLFVTCVKKAIHGPDASKSSRRSIDQFGLRNALILTLKYCRLAQERGSLQFRYLGHGEVDGRKTLMFERRLPYTGDGGAWPDRVLIVHIDRELLVPTACLCYADAEKKVLLGRYVYTDIELNAYLPDSVFTIKGVGL